LIKETLLLFDANITDTFTCSGHTIIIPKLHRRNPHIGGKGTWRENGVLGNANRRFEPLYLSIFI